MDFTGFPTFDEHGNLLGNLTSLQGITPTENVLLSGPYQSATGYLPGNNAGQFTIGGSTLNSPQSSASQGSGGPLFNIGGSTLSSPGSPATPNAAPANPTPNAGSTPASTIAPGSLADYFARAIIIVLGFIFVAVGLNMLRPGTVPVPSRL